MLREPERAPLIFHSESVGGACSRRASAGRATGAGDPEPPPPGLVPSCAEGDFVLRGIICSIIGNIQANEAEWSFISIGKGRPLIGGLLHFDAMDVDLHAGPQ